MQVDFLNRSDPSPRRNRCGDVQAVKEVQGNCGLTPPQSEVLGYRTQEEEQVPDCREDCGEEEVLIRRSTYLHLILCAQSSFR